ncbi:hypothetical protein FRB99_000564 [Tulasnella sp. 403]|nr:hypothetical protein FRB99_000564 [Tulasnella sp. 403]
MVVLSIAMLGEFLSANVSTPFLLFMVEEFGIPSDQVGSYTGVLVSTFFVTQFLTSILWAAAADRHGRRAVLFISLLGNSLTCLAFGTARTFPQAVVIRLMQGVFGGSIGVARGAVAVITDVTNEARAYATIGFCWGLGGVAGAVIGGAFESPAKRWPGGIGAVPVFINYPYLLPCGIAASITFTGAVLSLFLGWDGGPREGLIRLPLEKDIPEEAEADLSHSPDQLSHNGEAHPEEPRAQPENVIDRVAVQTKGVRSKISGYFARRVREAYGPATPSPRNTPLISGSLPIAFAGRHRGLSHSTYKTGPGSAYGYNGVRSRLASSVTGGRGYGAPLGRRRLTGQSLPAEGEGGAEDLNFAQRLLLANEGNVTSMANLWVAAAINADNEEPFFDDSDGEGGPAESTAPQENGEAESVFMEDEEPGPVTSPAGPPRGTQTPVHRQSTSRPSFASSSGVRPRASLGGFGFGPLTQLSTASPRPSQADVSPSPHLARLQGSSQFSSPRITLRRGSSVSNLGLPSIYNNTGLSSPPALAQGIQLPFFEEDRPYGHTQQLSVISEGSASVGTAPSAVAPSIMESNFGSTLAPPEPEPMPSMWSQLPIIIILQYGILALHNTVHDQYFLTYLVSPYGVGGLGLNAAHFAQLIAMMCLAQIFYQFYLYPNIGPPRGAWSHLAMFRIGSALFIPSYLSVILYRAFVREGEDGNWVVMALLTVSTAVRFCGITFTYTAIAILLNYMSPPHLLWSASIKDGPAGFPYGFYLVGIACFIAILHSFTIR